MVNSILLNLLLLTSPKISEGAKMLDSKSVKLTIVFDNIGYLPDMETEWGFACVIETDQDTILFDTGNNGSILLKNMNKLNIEPKSIQTIIISHEHLDHVGGLSQFLEVNPNVKVYLPSSSFQKIGPDVRKAGATPIKVDSFQQIADNILSLGEMGTSISEQSIAIRTEAGLIIMTGCAHPGIVNVVKQARKFFQKESLYLVLGGFHLKNHSEEELNLIVQTLKEIGVEYVAPSHCTGEKAIEIFEQGFGNNFIRSGVGKFFEIMKK